MITNAINKYLIANYSDSLWGVTVTSTGTQIIRPGDEYPPKVHPSRYLFEPEKGRKLDEYQFIYITEGTGWFRCGALESISRIKAGDLIVLFPGEWHSYRPDTETGWTEHWIGCVGEIPQMWETRGIIAKDNPILHPGLHARIDQLFDRAGEYATALKPDYQKALGATAMEILGLSLYFDKANGLCVKDSFSIMERAKDMIFAESFRICPEEVAEKLNVSYSRFRKLFKSYFGTSPWQYILQIRIANAKELLTNTDKQIKEISWETGFENPDYFIVAFKRITGISPGLYRRKTRGE